MSEILVDYQIERLCIEEGMVTPFDPLLLNPHSLDVRLGNTIIEHYPNTARYKALQEANPDSWQFDSNRNVILHTLSLKRHSKELPYMLGEGEFVLAETLEVFNLPRCVKAQFHLKSSRAREGYGHLLAGYCDGGWNNSVLTMELYNALRMAYNITHVFEDPLYVGAYLPLYPGLKIGQMEFTKLDKLPKVCYDVVGHYNNDRMVQSSKLQ